jgi:hypothetical protein
MNIPEPSELLQEPVPWEVVYPKGAKLTGASDGQHYHRAIFLNGGATGKECFNSFPKVRHNSMRFSECTFDGEGRFMPSTGNNFWGTRRRGLMSGSCRMCYFTSGKEHGAYDDILGRYTFSMCTFDGCAAQGAQVEDRQHAPSGGGSLWPSDYSLDEMGDLKFHLCHFKDCGQERGVGRSSAAVTLYRTVGHHSFQRCVFSHGPKKAGEKHLERAIMFRSGESLEIRGCGFTYATPDNPLLDLWEGSIMITRSHFESGIIRIRQDVQAILIKGCTGKATIQDPDGNKIPIETGYSH